MKDFNHMTITGRLTTAPEIIATPSKDTYLKFTLASNKNEDTVNYYQVKAFGRISELMTMLGKGDKVLLSGTLHQEKWKSQDKTSNVIFVLYVGSFMLISKIKEINAESKF